MRSVDNKSKYGDEFTIELSADEPSSPGILGVTVVLFVIYAITSRPVLYGWINEWLSEVLTMVNFLS